LSVNPGVELRGTAAASRNGTVPLDVLAITLRTSGSSERMDSSFFQSAEWYKAATLAERIDTPPATTQESEAIRRVLERAGIV